MKRKKRISCVLAIIVFNMLFQVQLLSQIPKNDISINLTVVKPLKLVKNETGDLSIYGSVQVKLINKSNKKIEFLYLHEHSLLFSSENTAQKYIPFHSCSCVLLKKQGPEFIILEPGKSKKLIFDNWMCDGGSFGIPQPGTYQLYFRVLEKSRLNRSSSYNQFRLKRDTGIQEIIKECRDLLNEENFWKEAIYSNSVLVKF